MPYQIAYTGSVDLRQGDVTRKDAFDGLAQLQVEGDDADAVDPG